MRAGRELRLDTDVRRWPLVFVGCRKFSVGDLERRAAHAMIAIAGECGVRVVRQAGGYGDGTILNPDQRRLEADQRVGVPREPPAKRRPLHIVVLQRAVGKKEGHHARCLSGTLSPQQLVETARHRSSAASSVLR